MVWLFDWNATTPLVGAVLTDTLTVPTDAQLPVSY